MEIELQKSKIEVSHPNFNGAKLSVEFQNGGVFPGVLLRNLEGAQNWVQLMPQDNGTWVVRIHENATATALVFDDSGQQVYPAP